MNILEKINKRIINEEENSEKKVAMKMRANGYKFVMIFPSSMDVSPLYVRDRQMATSLLRKEFKLVKDTQIMSISKFMGEKEEEQEN